MKLETKNLKKYFGSVKAVDGLNTVWEGKGVRGLIGPNGAGKTVLFNLITGVYPPTEGKVLVNEEDVTGLSLNTMVSKKVGRTFQQPTPFNSLTVMENIKLGYQADPRENPVMALLGFGAEQADRKAEKKAEDILDGIGLADKKDMKAMNLNIGDAKLLEIGRVMMFDPDILLLDEPTAGIPRNETDRLLGYINRIKEDLLIIIVEHKMEVIMSISDNIKVLSNGKLLACGSPREIRENKEVQKVYLGEGG